MEKLKRYDLNCNIFDVYNYDGLSMQELLCQFFTKINECVDFSNSTLELCEWLTNEGLKLEVAEKLVTWLNDGTLENVINESLFENLDKKFDDVTKSIKNMERKEINILDFGAKGDGSTDDTKAFKDALSELGGTWSNKPSTLIIPAGVYRITETIEIKRGRITIEGSGEDQTIILVDGNVDGFEFIGNTYLYAVKMGNLSISGKNCKTGLKINGVGLHSRFYNITIENCDDYGLHITGGSFDFPIDYLHVRGCGKEGIFVDEPKSPNFIEISYISFNKCTVVDCGKDNKDIAQWTISGSDALMLNDCKANEGLIGFKFINNVRGIFINNVYMDGIDGTTSQGYKAHIFNIDDVEGYNFNISNVYGWHIDTVARFIKGGKANIRNVDVIWGDDYRNNSIVVEPTYEGNITVDYSCTRNFGIIDPNNKILYPMYSSKKMGTSLIATNGYKYEGDGLVTIWGSGTTVKSGQRVTLPLEVSEVYHIDFTSCDDGNTGSSTTTQFYPMAIYGNSVYLRSSQDGRKFTYKAIAKL